MGRQKLPDTCGSNTHTDAENESGELRRIHGHSDYSLSEILKVPVLLLFYSVPYARKGCRMRGFRMGRRRDATEPSGVHKRDGGYFGRHRSGTGMIPMGDRNRAPESSDRGDNDPNDLNR